MLKEKWSRPTLAGFIMWVLRKAGLFVDNADGTGYVINPKFVQCGSITFSVGPTAYTRGIVTFPVAFTHMPRVFVTPVTYASGFSIDSASVNNVTINAIFFTGSGSANTSFSWIAIDPLFLFGKQMFGGGALLSKILFARRICSDRGWAVC